MSEEEVEEAEGEGEEEEYEEEEEEEAEEEEEEEEEEADGTSERKDEDTNGAAAGKAHIQDVLTSIFAFYSIDGQVKHRMTSARFQRMALDAQLVDSHLTTAKVDVVFHKICKGHPYMSQAAFKDALVRLAVIKYPGEKQDQAVVKMYQDHLSSFSASNGSEIANLPQNVLSLLSASRKTLMTLYQGYFPAELYHLHGDITLRREAENAFAKFCADFGVAPAAEDNESHRPKSIRASCVTTTILSKAAPHAVFREVARIHKIPDHVTRALLDELPMVGRHFTYVHFAVSLVLLAGRCFGEGDVSSLVKLFEWMDASRGGVAFTARSAGKLQSGSAARKLRVMPERDTLPKEVVAELGTKAVTASDSSTRPSLGGRKTSKAQTRRFSFSAAAARGPASATLTGGRQNRLPDAVRGTVSQIFAHYTSIGDPLNCDALSTQKFTRFLRDAGLIQTEVMLSSSSAPRQSLVGRPRKNSVRYSVTESYGGRAAGETHGSNSGHGLPLRVFTVPPLKHFEGDLIFVQAIRVADAAEAAAAATANRRRSIGGYPSATFGSDSTTRASLGGKKSSHMTLKAFAAALADIAVRCLPSKESGSREQALEALSKKVLEPLLEALDSARGGNGAGSPCGSQAGSEIPRGEKEVACVFEQCRESLQWIFKRYAKDEHLRKPSNAELFWTQDSAQRFSKEFGLFPELSPVVLKRIVVQCAREEEPGRLYFAGFEKVLALLAQTLYAGRGGRAGPISKDKVLLLLSKLNCAGTVRSSASAATWNECNREKHVPLRRFLFDLQALKEGSTEKGGHALGEQSSPVSPEEDAANSEVVSPQDDEENDPPDDNEVQESPLSPLDIEDSW